MTSEEALELLEERINEYKLKAQQQLEDRPKRAVYHFSKAAALHEKLAAEVDSDEVEAAHRKQAEMLRENAREVIERLGMVTTEVAADEGSSLTSGSEEEQQSVGRSTEFLQDPPEKDLEDVGGMDDVKTALEENVQKPLENPRFYEQQAVGIQNGVLFYGPPGTGKSHLAECFAGQLGYRYAEIKASEITSKWVGEAPKKIKQLFDEAREHEPCVVFLDELDALATDRSGGPEKTNSERQVVTELLQQMQAIQGSDILVIAATNKLEDLDTAITRSQRFNTEFHVGPPNTEARKEILKVQLEAEDRVVDWESMDWQKLVEWSEGFSAADLADVVQQAARESASESTDHGRLVPVQYRHVLEAMKGQQASLKDYSR